MVCKQLCMRKYYGIHRNIILNVHIVRQAGFINVSSQSTRFAIKTDLTLILVKFQLSSVILIAKRCTHRHTHTYHIINNNNYGKFSKLSDHDFAIKLLVI